MSTTQGAVSFQSYWSTHIENGGGCFSNEHIEAYLEVVMDKKENPIVRCEVFQSFLHTPAFRAQYVIQLLSNIAFDEDDPAKKALDEIKDWVISSLRYYLPIM